MSTNKNVPDAVLNTVTSALLPLISSIWNVGKIKELLPRQIAAQMHHVPPENIIAPKLNVGGPAIEALRYAINDEQLLSLFVNFLAIAMNKDTTATAHPAFVEIIRQLTPDEAKVITLFKQDVALSFVNVRWEFNNPADGKIGGKEVLLNYSHLGLQAQCENPQLGAIYIDNLCRLGLAEMPAFFQFSAPDTYAALEADPIVQSIVLDIQKDPDLKAIIERKGLRITALGHQFIKVCLPN